MFSNVERCLYRRNSLAEVICQLRFPEILSIEANAPVEFQEAIRQEFPQFQRRQEMPVPPMNGMPPQLAGQKPALVTNYQFMSADGTWRVNLTSKFISLTCNRYTRWEDFAGKLDKPLAAFIQTYNPAYFERVGLRYVNFISRKMLNLEGTPFKELITPAYLGPLSDDEIFEGTTTRCCVDAEFGIHGGCRVKLHAGPGMVKRGQSQDNETKFIFDMDLYMPGNVPVNYSAGALQTIHSQAWPIFRGAITEKLHEALDPM